MKLFEKIRKVPARKPKATTEADSSDAAAPIRKVQDPSVKLALGYPHTYDAPRLPLSQGMPVRADEIIWIEAQIDRLAEAGAIDEGTETVLDSLINTRLAQWNQAIELEHKQLITDMEKLQRHTGAYIVDTQARLDNLTQQYEADKAEEQMLLQQINGYKPDTRLK